MSLIVIGTCMSRDISRQKDSQNNDPSPQSPMMTAVPSVVLEEEEVPRRR